MLKLRCMGLDMNWKKCFFIIMLCLNVTACLEPPQDILKIGSNGWIGYEPLYLARSLGYLPPNKVRIIDYPSTSEASRAFRNELIDGLMTSLDEAISLLPFVPDMRVILILDISDGGDGIISQPHIEDLSQLKGKKIGAENTILSRFLLQQALSKVGLSLHHVKLVPINWDQHEAAFVSKQVDAIISGEPILSSLIEKGGINLFDSHQIPNQIFDVLIVREQVLENRKKTLKMIGEAWFKSVNFIEQQQEAAIQYIAAKKRISSDIALEMIKGVRFLNLEANYYFLDTNVPILRQKAESLANWMAFHGYISKKIPYASMFYLPTNSILPEIISWL
jgi:NitT/TauT family transport system substrate-binding protein